MDKESKILVSAAVRMVAEVAMNPIRDALVNPALFAVAMGHVNGLLKVVEQQQAAIEAAEAENAKLRIWPSGGFAPAASTILWCANCRQCQPHDYDEGFIKCSVCGK